MVASIEVYKMACEGPFWWSTPGLGDNDDPNGVKILCNWNREKIAFRSPAEIEREKQEFELEN